MDQEYARVPHAPVSVVVRHEESHVVIQRSEGICMTTDSRARKRICKFKMAPTPLVLPRRSGLETRGRVQLGNGIGIGATLGAVCVGRGGLTGRSGRIDGDL